MLKVYDTTEPSSQYVHGYFRTQEEAEEFISHCSRTDRSGTYPGSSYLAIVTVDRESKPCRYCGGEVESDNPDVDFCRGCYYGGNSQANKLPEVQAMLRGETHQLLGVKPESVGIWHTGGGCFSVGAYVDLDGTEWEILIGSEGDVPDSLSEGVGWALIHPDGWGYQPSGGDTITDVTVLRDSLVDGFGRALAGEESDF